MTGWLTLAGLVVVALITAYTTDRRLSRQIEDTGERQERELKDAAERQQRSLDAESERQQAALAHDRVLADLADLRSLLDEAAVALNTARDARDKLSISFTEHGVHMPEAPKNDVKACGNALFALLVRLHIRLGADEPIVSHFSAASGALLDMWWAVANFEDDDDASLKEKRARVRAGNRTFTDASLGFSKAAVARAGTVPTSSGS